jgi:hypothetical protein
LGQETVLGRDARTLVGQFGEPDLDVREGTARKLQFAGPACVLDAYLYPRAGGRRAGGDAHRCPAARRTRHGPRLVHCRAQPAQTGSLSRASAHSGRFRHDWTGIAAQRLKLRHEAAIAAVARCDGRIADHPVAADPLDRRASEDLAK